MFLTDDLVNILKNIFEDNLKTSQKYNKVFKQMSMIMKTSRRLHKLMERKKVDRF